MSKKRKEFKIPPIVQGLGSLILLAFILVFASAAVKFCMGLFMTGDYVVVLPGKDSPIIQNQADPNATIPAGVQREFVMEVARGTLTVTGDVMLHMPIVNSVKSDGEYDFTPVFRYVAPKITNSDYAVANLETTLSGTDGKEYTGFPQFNSPDAIAAGLQSSGFDMLLTGNNHCYDYGTQGLKRTLEVISGQGLASLGTTAGSAEPGNAVKDISGVKVGMVSYTYGEIGDNPDQPAINGLQTDSGAAGLINTFDYNKLDLFYEEITAHIADMEAKGAETIVLYIHWGNEYQLEANDHQKAIAQKLCDLGVDVILGAHPHVVEPIELLTSTLDPEHKTVCLYSLGNFLSNQRGTNTESLPTGHTEDGLLFSMTFVKYTDGNVYLEAVNALPTWVRVEGSGGDRKYTVIPLEGDSSGWADSYGLIAEHVEAAKDSYDRTMALIGPGLEAVKAYLAEDKAARQPFIAVG